MTEIINKNSLIIKNFTTAKEMEQAFPLVQQMYAKMSFANYRDYVAEMIKVNNFAMIGVFSAEKLVGVCGYWILLMLYCGRYIQASNLVVDKNMRGLGVGKIIINHLEEIGRKNNCDKIILDSYTENKKSHSLYYREGFHIRGFHFMKSL